MRCGGVCCTCAGVPDATYGLLIGDVRTRLAVRRVLGYRPTCECGAVSARCVVLDPFAGSGTTLQAARHLGRDSIGIELNEEYARQAEARINTVPRFAKVKDAKRVKPAKNQLAMFE